MCVWLCEYLHFGFHSLSVTVHLEKKKEEEEEKEGNKHFCLHNIANIKTKTVLCHQIPSHRKEDLGLDEMYKIDAVMLFIYVYNLL